MAHKVVWFKRALSKLKNITLYLENEWSEKTSNEFLIRLNSKVQIISKYPRIGEVSNKMKEVRKFVITKEITLYYKIKDNNIIVLTLFDKRQNPAKLKV